ncbi:Ribosome biogenesis protein BOP1 homolog [Trichuris trichiura]|uniref:Ribosome biogenesis protein BOP1 homolog n=1 Tax=Trichuris trichiura TaxID=36087 RepID=A0A077YWZ5_TRITR|nr:Ribosome biogenesis protein BOP1 homolog [Trichuris trichiura]
MTSVVFCSAYPMGTFPNGVDESQRAKQVADALVKSYVEETNEGNYQDNNAGPPGSMPDTFEPAEVVFESSGGSDFSPSPHVQFPGDNDDKPPLIDPLFEHVPTETTEDNLVATKQIDITPAAHVPLILSTGFNESATHSNKADSDSLALRELLTDGSERRPLGYLDPGSLTLTTVIVVAVIFMLSLVGLSFLTVWQYRRRRSTHRWTVGKSKSPAFQVSKIYSAACTGAHLSTWSSKSDAWCYENVSDGGTMKKRDSVYLSGATLKPYAYVGSLSTSNGTTRSSVFSENATTHSLYSNEGHHRWFDGELHAGCTPYREKLVS